ncbi:MAG: DUF2835 domain-containing protein [Sedimenticola sp.]|nr:DUF2835 domain-containing protein [Sedimenticola sp.]
MKRHRFQINLTSQEYLHYYRGQASAVIVQADDGRTLQLPANSLRPFVTASGISGRFELTLDDRNKLVELRRL